MQGILGDLVNQRHRKSSDGRDAMSQLVRINLEAGITELNGFEIVDRFSASFEGQL